jgi:hypothetical protein
MTVETPPVDEQTTPPAGDAPPSGESEPTAYEKALEAERTERKKLEVELKKRVAQDEKARLAAMDENARAVEEAKLAARQEVTAEYEAKILGLRVQARASSFHDPSLVAGLLELPADASDDEIDKALEKVAAAKPYLVKAPGAGVPPLAQGPRGTPPGPADAGDWLRTMVNEKRQG